MSFRDTMRAVERDNREQQRSLDAHMDEVCRRLNFPVMRTDSLDDGKQRRTSPGGEILSFSRSGTVPTEDAAPPESLESTMERLRKAREQEQEARMTRLEAALDVVTLREKMGIPNEPRPITLRERVLGEADND